MNKTEEKQLVVYEAAWCGDCIRSKKVLEKYHIPYVSIPIEENQEAVEKIKKMNNGIQKIPTMVFPSGKILIEPSDPLLIQTLEEEGLLQKE